MSGAATERGFAAALGQGDVPTGPRRLEAWAGEARLNLVRLAALILFYGYHLVNAFVSREDASVAGTFHVAATALVMVWSVGAVVLWLYLSRRWVPTGLKYAVTAWDTVLVTALLVLAGGPRSPLLILYFLVIAAAPLRLSLRLVYAATLLALAEYGFVLAHYAYYVVGYERYYADAAQRIPRPQQVILALGLVAAGVLAGQVVRQTRRLIDALPATADAGSAARDAEVRQDSKLVAGGLIVMAVLVAAGLFFSAVLGPERLGSYPALPFIAAVCVVFVIAVAAALLEVRQPSGAAPQDRAAGR